MICFEVQINGKKTYTAGVRDGVLSFDVTANTYKDGTGYHLLSSLGGLTEEKGSEEHIWWGDFTKLSPGDVVTVKIVSADEADEPTKREPRITR